MVLVGAVADDDSGMTDLLGMFAEHDVNTVMFFEIPPPDILEKYSEEIDVVSIGTQGRSIEASKAYRRSRDALETLRDYEPHMYYLKYCSTFDSTPRGNIGQMIDAGLDLFGGHTIALPALPVNGRTTYMGNHFANGVRLDRSPMKDHPLNPMTEADLRVWLGSQTKRRIGLCDHNVVRKGARAIARELHRLGEDGADIIILDAIERKDIRNIARAVCDYQIVTGSSALAMELPPIWKERKLFIKREPHKMSLKKGIRAGLVIAGSCSETTMGQNRYALERGFHGLRLDAINAVGTKGGDEVERIVRQAKERLRRGKNVLIYSASKSEDLMRTKDLGLELGLSDVQVGEMIANANAEIAKALVDDMHLNKLIVAGGETSGAVCKKLKLIGLYVGKQIDPGVPMCLTISDEPESSGMSLSLKSGNFGRPYFYVRALEAMDVRFRHGCL
jgi:uncharacterized protein YgbK (DUF1537 family)